MANKISRRSFLQLFTTTLVAAPALLSIRRLFAAVDLKSLPKGAKPLDENAGMAKALGFKQDVKQADGTKFAKIAKARTEGKDMRCGTCAQFVKKNESWGECKIIKGGLVNVGGWCNSYLEKKPA